MQSATVNGVSLEYERRGEGEPVVFIHGALIADAFHPLLQEPSLADRHELMAYRRRGYGGSSPTGVGLNVADQAADCRELIRYLGLNQVHVVGHSWGGAMALQLAVDNPEAVRSLALLEPALMVGESAEGYRESLRGVTEEFRSTGPEKAVDAMLEARLPGYRGLLERMLPGAIDAAVRDAGATFESELPALLDWEFGEPEASRIDQPVLSVLGAESVRLSPRFQEAHDWLLTHVAHAEGYVLRGAHHFLQLENSAELAGALAAFYERHT